jgi:hypothetical protein
MCRKHGEENSACELMDPEKVRYSVFYNLLN